MANSKTKSTASHLCPCRNSSPLLSPSHSATDTLTSRSSSSTASFFSRATSPTRVRMCNRNYRQNILQSSSPVRLSVDRTASPGRSLSLRRQSSPHSVMANQKRTCACSPTTHPGSFRCALHKAVMRNGRKDNRGGGSQSASYYSGSRLNFRRSAMANSIVRIGGVEGDLVKRVLSALIRPSFHHLRRRSAFEPRPSRLSAASVAEAECEES